MKLWKKIKTSLTAVVCNEDQNCKEREGWESYHSNNEERRIKKIRESYR
jgi:hypothetical protein